MFFSNGTSNKFLSIKESDEGSTNLIVGKILCIDLAYKELALSGKLF